MECLIESRTEPGEASASLCPQSPEEIQHRRHGRYPVLPSSTWRLLELDAVGKTEMPGPSCRGAGILGGDGV